MHLHVHLHRATYMHGATIDTVLYLWCNQISARATLSARVARATRSGYTVPWALGLVGDRAPLNNKVWVIPFPTCALTAIKIYMIY